MTSSLTWMLGCYALLRVSSFAAAFDWAKGTPESQGFAPGKLEAIQQDLSKRKTAALLVIRNERVVLEWYAAGHGPGQPHYTASMAKGLVAGVSAALAVADGLVTLDAPAAKFIPRWKEHPQKARITLRHLGSHTSGLEDAEEGELPHEKLVGWKGDFWKRLEVPRDPFTLSRDTTPLLFEPGTRHQYSNPGIAMMGYMLAAAVGPDQDVRGLLRTRLMQPLGISDAE